MSVFLESGSSTAVNVMTADGVPEGAAITRMSFLDQISVLILTYNEAPNIGRTIHRLTWAKRIVVIDSGSTDETVEMILRYPQAEVVRRSFDDFATQCNFGLSQISSEWVLSLD